MGRTEIELTTVEAAYRHFSGTPQGSTLLVGALYFDATVNPLKREAPRWPRAA